jgi:ribosome-associated protein
LTKESQDEGKSRSQVKREFRELKDLGVQLTALSRGQLCVMPLSGGLRDAVLAAKEMPRNALQRQYRYISSLLDEEDVDTIRAALAGELQPPAEEVAAVHEAEGWRDDLLLSDEGKLTAFIERYPECDRTHLRQLVRNAKKERDLEKPPRSARQLYRYIRQLVRPM